MSESTAYSFAMVLKMWIGDNFISAEGPFRFSLDGIEVRITDCIGKRFVDSKRKSKSCCAGASTLHRSRSMQRCAATVESDYTLPIR